MPCLRRFALVLLLAASVTSSGCESVVPKLVSPLYRAVVPRPHLIFGPEDAVRWVEEGRRAGAFLAHPDTKTDAKILRRYNYTPHDGMLREIWRPSRRQVAHIRRLLYQRLEDDRIQPDWDYPATLNQHTVRYIGIVREGKRRIYIMGGGGNRYPKEWPAINDGGTSVFHALYDPATRKLLGPGYNGEA